MPLPIHVALTSRNPQIGLADLSEVAAAVQKQVVRDFAPIWKIEATVDAFAPERIPPGYWPIIVQDSLDDPEAAGYHQLREDNTPYALVGYGPTWSLTVSHECLEMLADPYGSAKSPANSLGIGQGRVDYLVEICDPCQDVRQAYSVNGILVSDFYTPNFFDPVASTGTRYSFTGAIQRPLQILPGGYVSWIHGGRAWRAAMDDDDNLKLTDHGEVAARGAMSLREYFDGLGAKHESLSNATRPAHLVEARADLKNARAERHARLFSEIDRRFARQDAATPAAPSTGRAGRRRVRPGA